MSVSLSVCNQLSFLEYIWLDKNNNFRSKIKVLKNNKLNLELSDIPEWNYDGSSTEQADTKLSEIILKPHAVYKNPLLKSNNNRSFIVVCSTYKIDGTPLENNHRHMAEKYFNQKIEEEPWFGLEQEYFMFQKDESIPIDYTEGIEQGKFYCSPIKQDTLCNSIVEEHLLVCCEAGINISGINAEVAPGQWEFQVGPCVGISAGDELMAARYFLEKISAKSYIQISYHPKPMKDINGSGCHLNYSTRAMREEGGLKIINNAIDKLKDSHSYHMNCYGTHNDLRMTGKHETSSYDKFTSGIGSRNTSIRIGYETYKNKCGYFEDRRPASNIDPYLITGLMFKTTCLD
jgi:glutamine synthetase